MEDCYLNNWEKVGGFPDPPSSGRRRLLNHQRDSRREVFSPSPGRKREAPAPPPVGGRLGETGGAGRYLKKENKEEDMKLNCLCEGAGVSELLVPQVEERQEDK